VPILKGHKDYKGGIAIFGAYVPWTVHKAKGGDSTNYDAHSARILDLKDDKRAAITHFRDMIAPKIRPGVAIAIVPSHDPAKTGGGLSQLAAALASKAGCIDASGCLVRKEKVMKLARGGPRDISVHTKSIDAAKTGLFRGRDVLLIDDVAKTGNSLAACKEILLKAGARSVDCVAIGKT